MNQLEKQVLSLIPVGGESPRPSEEIAQATEINKRSVMAIVSRLVTVYRIPIVAVRDGVNNGYYIPSTEEERTKGLRALENQTKEQIKRLNVVTYCSLTEWQKYLKEGEDDGSNSAPN